MSDLYALDPVAAEQIPADLAEEIDLHPLPPIGVYVASRDEQPPIGYVVRFPTNTLAWSRGLACTLIPGVDATAINQALDRLVAPCRRKGSTCPT